MPNEVKETNENEETAQTASTSSGGGAGSIQVVGRKATGVLGKRKRYEYEKSY